MTHIPVPDCFAFGSPVLPGLAKVNEEAGEVIQEIGKLQMTGGRAEHFSGVNLHQKLAEELADLHAGITFFVMHNPHVVNMDHYTARYDQKLALFRRWRMEQAAQYEEEHRGG